jgi:hypothetical protein
MLGNFGIKIIAKFNDSLLGLLLQAMNLPIHFPVAFGILSFQLFSNILNLKDDISQSLDLVLIILLSCWLYFIAKKLFIVLDSVL